MPGAFWKPAGDGESDLADPRPARRHHRPAVFPAVDDEPAGAGVVRARASRAQSLSAVRAVEPRVDAGAARLSVPARAVDRHARCRPGAGRSATRCSSGCARLRRWRACRAARRRLAGADASRATQRATSAPPTRRAPAALVHAGRDRLAPAARGQQPHHAERRAVPLLWIVPLSIYLAHASSSASTARAGTGATSSSRCSRRRSA